MEKKKISLTELRDNPSTWEEAVIVFTADSFEQEYSEESRSYKISSDAKYFNPSMIANSLFGDCLDGSDKGVRLDMYISRGMYASGGWKVDYCYITR